MNRNNHPSTKPYLGGITIVHLVHAVKKEELPVHKISDLHLLSFLKYYDLKQERRRQENLNLTCQRYTYILTLAIILQIGILKCTAIMAKTSSIPILQSTTILLGH